MPILSLYKKYFHVALVFYGAAFLMFITSSDYPQLITAQEPSIAQFNDSGPGWIKKELIKSGAFNIPGYEFTNEFDSELLQTDIKGLFFKGLPYHGRPTKVFCWYGVPKNLLKGDKAPAVVLLHGGGGTAFPEWVEKWTNRGYIAISIALEGQVPGERIVGKDGEEQWPTFQYSGPKRNGFFADAITEKLQDQWFYHAVADIIMATSLLESFPEVDTENIGITGISWGGILTNVVTGIDHRYAFAIPVYGCGFLQETPNYKKILGQLTKSQQEFYLKNWEPSLYLPLQKQPTLFVNGTNDFHFTMNSFTKTYEASLNEKYLYVEHNMKHGHQPGWTPETIYSFSDYITNHRTPPVKLEFKKVNKNNEVVYMAKGKVSEAFLFYTTDMADLVEDSYEWTSAPARISSFTKTITASLPKNTVAYFINAIDSKGIMYSSPMRMDSKNDNNKY